MADIQIKYSGAAIPAASRCVLVVDSIFYSKHPPAIVPCSYRRLSWSPQQIESYIPPRNRNYVSLRFISSTDRAALTAIFARHPAQKTCQNITKISFQFHHLVTRKILLHQRNFPPLVALCKKIE